MAPALSFAAEGYLRPAFPTEAAGENHLGTLEEIGKLRRKDVISAHRAVVDIKACKDRVADHTEQVRYLESDTIQKSKYDKLELLVEKKDEIITEKEKNIFELNNTLNSANQKISNLQQQIETFNLVKKDLF